MTYSLIAAIFVMFFGMRYDAYLHDQQVKKLEREMEIKYEAFLNDVREEFYQNKDKEFESDSLRFVHNFAELELACSKFEPNIEDLLEEDSKENHES